MRIKGFSEDINIHSNKNTLLVVEDRKLFACVVKNIMDYNHQLSKELLFLDDQSNVLHTKRVMLIKDIFDFDVNSKTILNKLYAMVKSGIEDEIDTVNEIRTLMNSINQKIIDISNEWNFELEINDAVELEAYFKAINMRVNDEFDSIIDKALTLLEILSELMPNCCFVFSHILDYFADKELEEMLKYIRYKNLEVLFIENKSERADLFDSVYLIDQDFELLYNQEVRSK